MRELRNITIGDMLEETANKYPTVQAVKYIETEFDKTWYEFNAKVDKIARGLLGMGLKKGDHVGVWAVNLPQWITLYFAAAKIGVVIVTVNTNYKEKEFEYIMKHSDAKAVFICDQLKDIDCEKTIYHFCPEIDGKEFYDDGTPIDKLNLSVAAFPKLKMVVSFDNYYSNMYHWNDIANFGILISDSEYKAAKECLDPNDVINIQYTSGTTGFPKGVMLTHKNLVNNGQTIGDGMKFTEKDRLCIPVPFFHCFGSVLGILAATTHGTTMLPLLWYTPMKVMHIVEYEKCTALHGVPTMFIGIFAHRDFDKYKYDTLRTGIMAGANCPEELMRNVREKMNMREIVSVYGLTEASPGCTMTKVDDTLEKRVGTVGTAFPHVNIKIVDVDTETEEISKCEGLGVGIQGELCVHGYNIMKGYYNNEAETKAIKSSDGWLRTGDLAEVDSDGYYKITGRIKDMIIRGGENISPKEIEDVIRGFKGVKDVAVIAVPSERYGEEVCAVIVPMDGVTLHEAEITKDIANILARHKIPSYIEFMGALPLTASGKIQKYKLRETVAEKLKL